MLKLYSYFRSSAAYRVRIGLNIKNVDHAYAGVHLRDGAQRTEAFRAISPMAHVPAIDHDGFRLAESMAILQYLDALWPDPPLWPSDPRARARVTQVCEVINAGIQPLINLKVTRALGEFGVDADGVKRWTTHWLEDGLRNLERLLAETAGRHACGDVVSAADCLVVPMCFSAERFGVSPKDFPTLARIDAAARDLDAFARAHPARQPDHEP